jgi:methionyl aminopeptidase
MSLIKTAAEIEALKEGGVILSRILAEVRQACVAGVTTEELDAIARKRMEEAGGKPSFLGHKISEEDPAFPGALCTSINDEVVHGLPIPGRAIKDGDVVGLDIGMWYKGLCTDMATTVIVGEQSEEVKKLVADTRESLVRGISVIKAGAWIHNIGEAVEDYLKPKKYGIVKDLVGHGVGHAIHEEPSIPNYREPRAARVQMKPGMVLAIEPMVSLGTWRVDVADDEWTIKTADGAIAAHFEVTVAVTEDGFDLITPWPDA